MKVFLDSANLEDIKTCLEKGVLKGITTNPSILAKEPKTDFVKHIRNIVALMRAAEQLLPLSVEVFTEDPKEMVTQALQLVEDIAYENINIKIPVGFNELEAVYQLSRGGIPVNCTCIFTEGQASLAANAGAKYISIFMGRTRDIGGDPLSVIQNTRNMLDSSENTSEIIVGSIRHAQDIAESHVAGAHIVTASQKLIQTMASHPQTTASVQGFLNDFSEWIATSETVKMV